MGGPKDSNGKRTRNRSSKTGGRPTSRSRRPGDTVDARLREVLAVLKSRFHVDLSLYKANTIRRRIERQMAIDRIDGMKAYAAWLRAHPEALDRLHDALFVNVTEFFRDPESFDTLKEVVFPKLLANRSDSDPIRVWVPGCSTGEEAFSIAIALQEFLDERAPDLRYQIFATDISEEAIARARRAIFPSSGMKGMNKERLDRFFEPTATGFRIRKDLRERCVVSRHDVTTNPPFAKLDLVSCRNVLIYFGGELQKKIFPIFHFALKPGGFLWLGHAETPGASSKLFAVVDKPHKIYSKIAGSRDYLLRFERAALPADPHLSVPPFPRPLPAAPRPASPPRKSADKDRYIQQLEQELDAMRAHQQTMVEQFESAQEEMSAAGEEMQATNEELESAKEELQSANEELTTVNDELHRRNEELVSLNEKLARGEDRFRLLVEGVKDYAIYLLDPQGNISSWNEGARRLKGYETSEVLGTNYARFFPPELIAVDAPQIELERARIDGRFETEGWRVRKDGSRFWANVVVTRIHDSHGTLIGFSKVTRDLTERRKADDTLRKANESLEERVRTRTFELETALKARDEFLSIASHELKTPLTGLKLQLQMAKRNTERGVATTGKTLDTFARALKQATSLEELVDDLLDVARIQTGHFKLEPAEVGVAALIEDGVSRFAEPLAHVGSTVELALDRDLCARWDGRRIAQVLVNLMSNALKYAPGASIRIAAARQDGAARIVFEDFGPGIPPEKHATIFDRFERAGASPSVGGLGLGLFITRRIVEAHGGNIRVESTAGSGARFVIELPLDPPNGDPPRA